MSNTDYVIGAVEDIGSRDTSYGTMWDISVGGMKYGMGKIKPPVEVGDCVKFSVQMNGKFMNVARGTLTKHVIEEGDTLPELPKQVREAQRSRDSTQEQIMFQAARNAAIETTKLLLQANAVGIKATTKWGEAHDLICAKINDLTRKYYHDTKGYEEFVGPTPVKGANSV